MNDESDRFIVELTDLVRTMVSRSGTSEGFDADVWLKNWLDMPLPALNWVRPRDYIVTAEGRACVVQLMRQMESGTFA